MFSIRRGRVSDWDIEAYDRLCHKQDRAFSVPGETFLNIIFFLNYNFSELYDFLEKGGLQFVSLNAPRHISVLTIDDPVNFGNLDLNLRNDLKKLSIQDQMTVADLVDGTVGTHEFYAKKIQKTIKN